jgi:protoheme IX farnesyltransferase
MVPAAIATTRAQVGRRLTDYLILAKPRVVLMVLVTTTVGFYLGAWDSPAPLPLLHTLFGTALAAGGTLALNQYIERDRDAHMVRTRMRPLPDGRLHPWEALLVGLTLLASGLSYLLLTTNALAAGLTAAVAAVYLLAYTPLKPVTSLASIIGAVPGALPPVAGWAAARGELGVEPLVLFAIMFLWQIPHTLAIGCLYRDDYARAGIRVLPLVDRDGPSAATHAVAHCLALLPVALMPTILGFAGSLYFVIALGLGLGFLVAAIRMARIGTLGEARRLLMTSLVYLPALLATLAFDKVALLP